MKKLIFMSVIALLLNSCAKDGATGPKGDNGLNGTANIENYTVTVTPSQWQYSTTYSRWYYRYNTSINSQAAVLTYVMGGSGKQAIPYIDYLFECQYDMANSLFQSSPYIEFQYTSFKTTPSAPTTNEYFYIVAVPPALIKENPNVNWRDYNSVRSFLKLK